MKKIWILLVIALVVIFVGFREGLEATATIKAPPYDAIERDRIWEMVPQSAKYPFLQAISQGTTRDGNGNVVPPENQGKAATAGMVAIFYNLKYRTATAPITQADIDAYIAGERDPQYVKDMMRAVLTAYFLSPSPPSSGPPRPGAAMPAAPAPTPAPPSRPGPTRPAAATPSPAPLPGATIGGGQSTSRVAGGGTVDNRVWGPPFSGFGRLRGSGDNGDGSGSYPTLLGPPREKAPYMVGVGVLPPGPSSIPGDKDLIPDPYRVSQSYSPASNSSKNEPVPFLTDFSAFLK